MLLYDNGGVFRNITGNFLGPLLIDEATKATYVDILPLRHIVFDHGEEGFHRNLNVCFVYSCLVSYFVYDFGLGHNL